VGAIRNKEATQRAIVRAVGTVLARDGFRRIGINAIAAAAGVDKVLIYRYFGGLPKLIEAYAASTEFWPDVNELVGDSRAFDELLPAEQVALLVRNYLDALIRRPLTREILAWELVERNEATIALEEARERTAQALLDLIRQKGIAQNNDLDVAAISALLGSAINYLVIRSRQIRLFSGIDLSDESGWKRLGEALETMVVRTLTPR